MKKCYLTLLCGMFFAATFAQSGDDGFAAGNGTAGDPYQIATAAQLARLADVVNNSNAQFGSRHYMLIDDIDLSDYGSVFNGKKGWIPVGNQTNSFRGVFDGGGNTITGLYINDDALDYAGLFGNVAGTGAIIRRLSIENASITAGNFTGAIAGYAGGGIITDCMVSGGAIAGNLYVGGIAGFVRGDIRNCYATCSVSGVAGVGGIAGFVSGGSVTKCFALNAKVVATDDFSTDGTPVRLNRSGWTFPGYNGDSSNGTIGYSSQQAGGEGDYPGGRVTAMLDGDVNTFWHTRWMGSEPDYPHWFIVDLGEEVEFQGVMMQKRQSYPLGNDTRGQRGFYLETSMTMNVNDWVSHGEFGFDHTESAPQTTWLPMPVKARYVKVYFDVKHRGTIPGAMVAEFGLYRVELGVGRVVASGSSGRFSDNHAWSQLADKNGKTDSWKNTLSNGSNVNMENLLTADFWARSTTWDKMYTWTFEDGKLPVLKTGPFIEAWEGATIYVATNGNDATGNGSFDNPYRTIKHAASLATPGATILVRAGTYEEHSIRPPSGSADRYIVFKPASPTDEVIIKHPETFANHNVTPAVRAEWLAARGWTAAQTQHYTDSDVRYSIEGHANRTTDVFNLEARSYIWIEGFTFRDYRYERTTIDILNGHHNVVINNRFINIGTVHATPWHWGANGPKRGDVTLQVNGTYNVIRNNYFQSVFGEHMSIGGGSQHNIITENTIVGSIGKNSDHSGAEASTLGIRFGGNFHNAYSFNYDGGKAAGGTIWADINVNDFLVLRNVSHNVTYFFFNESGCERNWAYENIAYDLQRGANDRLSMTALPWHALPNQFTDFPAQKGSPWHPTFFTALWATGSTFDARWVNNVAYNVRDAICVDRSWRNEIKNNIVFEDANNPSGTNTTGLTITTTNQTGLHPEHGYVLKGGGPHVVRNNLWHSTRRTDFVSYMGNRVTVDAFRSLVDSPHELGVNPMFENPAKGDFRLRPGSPAIGTGDNGVDRGAFAIYPATYVGYNPNLGLLDDVNVSFSELNTYSARAGDIVELELRLTRPATRTMNFEVFPIAGDARLDLDFSFPDGQNVTFNAGQRTKTIRVEILPGNPQHELDHLLALSIRPAEDSNTQLEEVGARNQHFIKIRRVTKYVVNVNGLGNSTGRSVVQYYAEGETVTLDAGTRPSSGSTNYTFAFWSNGYHDIRAPFPDEHPNRIVTFTMPAHNLVVEAMWDPRSIVYPYVSLYGTPATGITISRSTLSLTAGSTSTLTATVQPNTATMRDVLWISSNPHVATVNHNGVVTAVSNGTAIISANTIGIDGVENRRYSANCTVTVTGGSVSVVLSSLTAHTFPSVAEGYETQASLSRTVSNGGTAGTGMITVALSGTNASSFLLRSAGGDNDDWKKFIISLDPIAAGATETPGFEVRPVDGLTAGTYNATVTVSAVGATSRTFNVTFTVLESETSTEHVPVTNIAGIPSTATSTLPLMLAGTASPANATNKTITWSVQNAGVTGATISGNTLNTTATGTVTVRATIKNGGASASRDYTQNFTIMVSRATLSGTVSIAGNAVFGQTLTANTSGFTSNPEIPALGALSYQWRRGTTNISGATSTTYTLVQADIGNQINVVVTVANCSGNVTSPNTAAVRKAEQTAPSAPTMESRTSTSITLTAVSDCQYRVGNGSWQSSPTFTSLTPNTSYTFTQRLAETATHLASPASSSDMFSTDIMPVNNITGVPATATANIPLTLTGTVVPANATNKTIVWSVHDAGTTGATISDNTLNTTGAGTVTVRATIANGVAEGNDYTLAFDIKVVDAVPNSVKTLLATSLQAWVRDGQLHITGLIVGETLSIYSATGALAYRAIAIAEKMNIPLSAQGVYIVQSGDRTIRVFFEL